MTHSQTQGAEGADDAGTEWFWRIVDANGLGNVPSDEAEALRLLCTKAARYDEGQSASTIPPGVRSLLRTARSGLATYGAGAFEGTILQIDAILAYDPIFPAPAATPDVRSLLHTARSGLATYGAGAFEGTIAQIDAILAFDPATPAPAATPGVPDSLREELARGYHEMRRLSSTGRPAWEELDKHDTWERSCRMEAYRFADQIIAGPLASLIAAQPAGQAGDAGAVKWGSANTVGELMAQLRTLPADAKIFGTFKGPEEKGLDYRIGVRGVLLSRERIRGRWIRTHDKEAPYEHVIWTVPEPAPDSTRTGAAETGCRLIGPKMTREQEERIAHNLCDEFGPEAVVANAAFAKAFYAELYAAARPEAPSDAGIAVDIQRMRLSDGRTDYFVRIKCGDRETTPYVFRERYKAEHHVAHFEWLFGLRPDEPDLMAYDEASHPNDPTPPSDPAPSGQAEG